LAPPTARLNFDQTPVLPKRFRYTAVTRLAEEGASRATVGEFCGHVDLQNVEVYFEASPKLVESIDRALSPMLAPLAEAFRGRLIEDESGATHPGALSSRIIDFRISIKPVGSCADKATGCLFNKPVACYTCFKFEPWLDAPHEKVLERLKADRLRLPDDKRMASINNDAILAVQQVIAECEEVKKQREGDE